MRKPKKPGESEPKKPVDRVSVHELRAHLREFLNADRPLVVALHGRNLGIFLPTGVKDWEHRWDWAFQRRTLRAHFATVIQNLPGE